MVPAETAEQGVWQAFHLLNQFDLPRGHRAPTRTARWSISSKIDWNAGGIKAIPMQEAEAAQDVSNTAQNWTGQDTL